MGRNQLQPNQVATTKLALLLEERQFLKNLLRCPQARGVGGPLEI